MSDCNQANASTGRFGDEHARTYLDVLNAVRSLEENGDVSGGEIARFIVEACRMAGLEEPGGKSVVSFSDRTGDLARDTKCTGRGPQKWSL